MKLIKSSHLVSAIPVRDFLNKISYQPSTPELVIVLGLIWESDHASTEARKKSNLTNSTEIDHQIRFALKDRVERSIRRLAANVRTQCGQLNDVEVELHHDDYISIEFFRNLPEVKVLVSDQAQNATDLYTPREISIYRELLSPNPSEEVILRKAQERVYAGDYACAYKLLTILSHSSERDELFYLMGLCTNFFGRTQESERCFSKLLSSKNPLSNIKSSYVIAMLYLRMHSREMQDLEKAEGMLEKAFDTINSNPQIDDFTFHQVFNRNGFALCLYRRGKVSEALELLYWGINKLGKDLKNANALHQSVLIYNAVQCLRSLGAFKECEKLAKELIAIDPLFPEYWLELGRTYLEQGKNKLAIEVLEKAIALDALIPEAHALMGYANVEEESFVQAVKFYSQACELKPLEFQWRLDLLYCLSEVCDWNEMSKIISSIATEQLTKDQKDCLVVYVQELESVS